MNAQGLLFCMYWQKGEWILWGVGLDESYDLCSRSGIGLFYMEQVAFPMLPVRGYRWERGVLIEC